MLNLSNTALEESISSKAVRNRGAVTAISEDKTREACSWVDGEEEIWSNFISEMLRTLKS